MDAYELLEIEFGHFCGNPNTVVCSSGSAALHLALETLSQTEGWEPKETEVIIPDLIMVACPRAATLAGMKCRFAEVLETGLMDPESVLNFHGSQAPGRS